MAQRLNEFIIWFKRSSLFQEYHRINPNEPSSLSKALCDLRFDHKCEPTPSLNYMLQREKMLAIN